MPAPLLLFVLMAGLVGITVTTRAADRGNVVALYACVVCYGCVVVSGAGLLVALIVLALEGRAVFLPLDDLAYMFVGLLIGALVGTIWLRRSER